MNGLHRRVAREDGFTLIELLVVIVIIGILLAIAVPSYLGFKDRANSRAAEADIRSAVPDAEAYYTDNQTYVALTTAAMRAVDGGLSHNVSVVTAGASTYCLSATVGNKSWALAGPGATGWYAAADCTGTATTP